LSSTVIVDGGDNDDNSNGGDNNDSDNDYVSEGVDSYSDDDELMIIEIF